MLRRASGLALRRSVTALGRRALAPTSRSLVSTAAKDLEAMDAYSRTVVGVVQDIGDAVVAINVKGAGGPGTGDSAGSGVILSPDGYVLTNAHVVGDAASVNLALTDGRSVRAAVCGRDVDTDLALLHADQGGLPFASLGDSDNVQVGQLVVAIGNPLPAKNGKMMEGFIQTDVALNPGNSGGPLVDSSARVVGINTAIIQGAQNLSFSVPASTANWVVAEIMEYGRVRRSYLGFNASERRVSRAMQREVGFQKNTAVQTVEVQRDSPAMRAGIEAGDLVLEVDGKSVGSIHELQRALPRPGLTVALRLLRPGAGGAGGRTFTVSLTGEERPSGLSLTR